MEELAFFLVLLHRQLSCHVLIEQIPSWRQMTLVHQVLHNCKYSKTNVDFETMLRIQLLLCPTISRRLSDVLKRKRANQKRTVGPSSRKTRQDDSSNLPSSMVHDLFTKGKRKKILNECPLFWSFFLTVLSLSQLHL